MVVGKDKTFTYDTENRLTSVVNSLSSESYLYDGDGGRVQKTEVIGQITEKNTYIGSLFETTTEDGSSTIGVRKKHIFAGSQEIATIELQSSNLQPRTYYYYSGHFVH